MVLAGWVAGKQEIFEDDGAAQLVEWTLQTYFQFVCVWNLALDNLLFFILS